MLDSQNMPNEIDDIEIMKKIRKGDFEAFRFLFDYYYQPLCNFACTLTSDIYKAEDAVQEVFEKIWGKKQKIELRSSIKAYLYTAVRNQCLNTQKSDSIRQKYLMKYNRGNWQSVEQKEIELEEFRQYLYDCIDKLPPRCKDIFQASRFENLKQEKIATKMQISIKTVKAQIGKALRYVRDCLEISYPEYL